MDWPDIGSAAGRGYLPVLAGGRFAGAVVGHDVEIVTHKPPRQPQLHIEALSVAEGDCKQDMATPGGIADVRNVAILDRLTQERPVDFPIAGGLDGMCQRLQPQPLPPVIFAQGLWHGSAAFSRIRLGRRGRPEEFSSARSSWFLEKPERDSIQVS
jgi:hypothetical protein